MKKAVLFSLVLLVVLMFVGCGDSLSGTYYSEGLVAQSFTFDGDKVTMSAFGVDANGTYEIDGDNIIISYSLFGQEYDWKQSFSK